MKLVEKANKRATKQQIKLPEPELDEENLEIEPELETEEDSKLSLKLPTLPCRKGMTITSEIAFDWFSKITDDNVKAIIEIYIYRVWPKIIRTPKYIVKTLLVDFSQSDFTNTFGGGEFSFIVNQVGAGRNQSLFKFALEVNYKNLDPIFDLDELDLTARTNTNFINEQVRRGKLKFQNGELVTGDGKEETKKEESMAEVSNLMKTTADIITGAMNAGKSSQIIPPPDSGIKDLVIMMNGNSDRQMTMMLEMMKQQAEATRQANLTMMEGIKAIANRPEPPKDDTLIKFFQSEATAAKEANSKLLQTIMDRDNTKADPMTQLLATMDAIDKIKERTSPKEEVEPEPEKKSTTDKLIDVAAQFIPMVMQGIVTANQNKSNLSPILTPGTPAQQPIKNPELYQYISIPEVQETIIKQFKSEVRGWEFAQELQKMYGKEQFQHILGKYAPRDFLEVFVNTGLRSKINASDAIVGQWIGEFVNHESIVANINGEQKVVPIA